MFLCFFHGKDRPCILPLAMSLFLCSSAIYIYIYAYSSPMFMLTPPLAALRNLLLFSISEEFTTFQHIRPGVGWGVGWDVNVHLHLHITWMLRCCYVGHGLGWGGMLTFILHTTWMLRCCYVGHGLGWGGMLTFICTCTPRGCYVAATWGMG